jgi:hypothetical protein
VSELAGSCSSLQRFQCRLGLPWHQLRLDHIESCLFFSHGVRFVEAAAGNRVGSPDGETIGFSRLVLGNGEEPTIPSDQREPN